ncbi:hypothetical protein QZH41_008806 [Actinostola sp. cb2023]|nr:hypothetical protein QZH41_008806 [Actinostola sp. cb2023]
MISHPHFERSISLNDLDSSLKVREHVQQDIVVPEDDTKHSYLQSSSQFTFVLQSFRDFQVDFKKFLYSYLIDFVVYRELEECRRLNWCDGLFAMVPVLTMGDGNCLMHAASIGMWAVSDRYHILRKLVYSALLEDLQGFYHKRWQREHEINNLSRHGYQMTEDQWTREWQIVLELVSPNEYPLGNSGMQFSSLEEIHIFILANVLRRTIIVVSNDIQKGNYDEPLSPLNFPGIYLPLQWDPIDCIKSPLVIGYAQGHFTAIVSFEDGEFDRGEAMDGIDDHMKIHGVPLETGDGKLLPVHFLYEDEEELKDGFLRQYLDCAKINHRNAHDNSQAVTLAAKMNFVPPPGCIAGLIDGFFSSASETYQLMVKQKNEHSSCKTPSLLLESCKTKGCEFFGTYETLNYCSKCLEEYLKKEAAKPLATTPGAVGASSSAAEPFLEANPKQEHHHYQQQQQQQQQPQLKHQIQQLQPGPLQQQQQQQQQQQIQPGPLQQQQQLQPGPQLQQQQQTQMMLPPAPQEYTRTEKEPQRKKCNTYGCKYTAAPECGDLCLRCHESEILAEQQMTSLQTMNVVSTPCVNVVNGCSYFGIPQQEGFCSRCYRRFCLEMQSSLRNEERASPPIPQIKPQQMPSQANSNHCQTQGCPKSGCSELYDRCVECYGECIKQFIHSSENRSLETFASTAPNRAPPSPQPSPPVHMPMHCLISGCQNEGLPQLNGRCLDCFQIRPFEGPYDLETPPRMKTQASAMAGSISERFQGSEPGSIPFTHPPDPQGAVGLPPVLPPGELPSQGSSLLYCVTPKCGRPLGEVTGTICTTCIMKKFQLKRKISPYQQQPFRAENTSRGDKREKSGSEARATEILIAREKLAPLYIPPHDPVQTPRNVSPGNLPGRVGTPQGAAAAMKVNTPYRPSGVAGGVETPVSGTKCLTPNCPFFANPETQFLCSTCYEKEQEEWKKITRMTQRHRTPMAPPVNQERRVPLLIPAVRLKECALRNCYNMESPGKNGLCDKCYQTAIRNERVWDSANRQSQRRAEPQRQQPVSAQKPISSPRKAGFIDAGGPCKTSGCLKFGTAEKGGLCDPCYEKYQRKQALRNSPSPMSGAASPVYEGRERMVPIRQRVHSTQDPLATSTLIAHDPIPVSQPHARVFGAGSGPLSNRCVQEGCRMTGSAELGGYCSKCFEDYTRRSSYPESVPDLTVSLESPTKPTSPDLYYPNSTTPAGVSTGLTTLPLTTPKTCAMPNCSNQVELSTMSHCRECLAKLYPQYTRSKDMAA